MLLYLLSDRPPTMSAEQIKTADMIITLGDLEGSYLNIFDRITNKQKIGVYGNHCFRGYLDTHGFINLHLKTIEIGGVTFGGFEGALRYKESVYHPMWTQEEAMALIQSLPSVDVLITHSPPYGFHDWPGDLAHTGLQAITWFIEHRKPKFHFHGHVDTIEEGKFFETIVKGVYQDIFYELPL